MKNILYQNHGRNNKAGLRETAKKFSISGLKLLGILKPHSYPELKNQQEAIHKAIRNPDYGPPVGDIAQGKKSAVILVSDKTRRTLAREIVPPLLDELSRGGVPSSGITVIIAVGVSSYAYRRRDRAYFGK